MIRKTSFAILTSVLFICLLIVQPALAIEYKLEFEAEATGVFFMFEGILVGAPPLVAFGEGEAKLDGDAVVSQTDGYWYGDFPAEMKMDGEIKGEMYMIEVVADEPVITETYKMELEFWNLESAGGLFSPEDDLLYVLAEMTLPQMPEVTCLGYKLELENVENDEELKMSGEGYSIAAVPTAFYIAIEMEADLFTGLLSIIFLEQPGLDPIVEAEVTLDD